MVTYYKVENGKIAAATPFEDVAKDWGVEYQSTEQEIVRAADGSLHIGAAPGDITKAYGIIKKKGERNILLAETDKYMLPDFPVTAAELEKIKAYRKYLRDLPKDAKFPDVDVLTFDQWSN